MCIHIYIYTYYTSQNRDPDILTINISTTTNKTNKNGLNAGLGLGTTGVEGNDGFDPNLLAAMFFFFVFLLSCSFVSGAKSARNTRV